jgi:rifampicin phosphotransferase
MQEYQFVRHLKDLGKEDLSLAGGKGANLGEMIRAGLPVPEGFVVLVEAYRKFVEENKLEKEIVNLLSIAANGQSENLKDAAERVKGMFAKGKIPADILKEIDDLYAGTGKPPVAVRSSATAEDLPGASFAGQYSTFLNVKGKEELQEAIKKCWASLWNERALSYRAKQNIVSKNLAHGVVVQKLITSEKSGILFTANPVNGRRDQLSLSSSWGLGEAVVSGEVDPDQWVIDKKTGDTVSEYIAEKKVMTVRKAEGVELVSVEPLKQEEVTLDEAERKELLDMTLKVEGYFRSPQDLEWAYAEGRLYLVQTRPITTLYPMPKPEDPGDQLRIYMNLLMFRQGMSAPITPMGIELFMHMLKGMFLNSKGRRKTAGWLKSAAGRIFVDVTEILKFKKVLDRMRSYDIPALMDTEPMTIKALVDVADRNITELQTHKKSVISLLFGLITKMGFGMFKLNFVAKPRTIYGTLFPHKATAKALEYGNRQLALLQHKRSKLQSIDEKLDFFAKEALTTGFTIGYGMTFYLMPLFGYLDRAGRIMIKYIDDAAVPGKPGREVSHGFATAVEIGLGSSELEKVERAVPGSVTTEMGLAMLRIAKKLDLSGEEPTPDHPEIKDFLEIYGHRSTEEIDIGVLSWKEEPTYVVNLINSYIDQKVYRVGLEKFDTDRNQAEQAITTIASEIREKGASRDAVRVEKLLRAHRKYFGARELPKSVLVKGIGILREVLLEIGAELKTGGRLDHETDIFFVTSVDIRSGAKLQDKALRNREEYERELLRTPVPRVMTSSGETIYAVTEDHGDDLLRGIPASPGVYEGLVKILKRPEEGNRLEKGDILVTASTNPAWTPLFLKIGGLIVETGTPMSHGPVVAREYGIPAVAGLRDATSRLEDGQRVRINGETGSVEILDSGAGALPAGADIRR